MYMCQEYHGRTDQHNFAPLAGKTCFSGSDGHLARDFSIESEGVF
jgi:hypothetical protein